MAQKFQRIYDYIQEYQKLVYDVYSKTGVAFLTTYFHINTLNTVWEDENLFAGSYDRVGEYSGITWDKILLLPVYFIEDVSTSFDGQETGYLKENETTFVIPSSYGFTPLVNDKMKLEQSYLRSKNDIFPIFNISGVDKSTNTDKTFWKVKVQIEQSITLTQLDEQVNDVYTFFEYDKNIHTLNNAQFLSRLLSKNESLRDTIKTNFYDSRSGYYFSN